MNLDAKTWERLELAARSAAAAGGFAAMGYYRNALSEARVFDEGSNPATEADAQATLAILRTLDPALRFATGRLLGRSYFAEELADEESRDPARRERMDELLPRLGGTATYVCRTSKEFARSFPNSLCVLIDGLDGTTNFRAGIPLFCSAVAFFLDGVPRVGAIYDPIHNSVYYGSVRENSIGKTQEGGAFMWGVQSGSNAPLPLSPTPGKFARLLGTHLTRSDPEKRREGLDYLSRIVGSSKGTYMINSGQLALAYVASGNLSAFVNNYTNIWDVAAGEVLVRAIRGRITDLHDSPIDYSQVGARGAFKVEVVASIDDGTHRELLEALVPSEDGGE